MADPWPSNLAERCEAVGWRVELKGGHYKVYDDSRLLLTFSSTPGDKRSMLNALSIAKRCGIEQRETQLKLKKERDRLVRIEKDRETNGFVVADVTEVQPVDVPAPAQELPNLGDVDGTQIVEVAPAMFKSPVMPKAVPLADAEELLLADHRVVYRCKKMAREDETRICHRTFSSVDSLRTHITFHTRDQHAKEQRETESREEKPVTPNPSPKSARTKVNGTAALTLSSRVVAAITTVEQLASNMLSIKDELTTIKDELGKIQVADAEMLRKVEAFDTISAALNKKA